MSAEHHQEHHERHERQHEQLEEARQEKLEQLSHHPEKAPEDSESRAEAAREVIHRQETEPEPAPAAEATPKSHHALSLDYHLNYAQTLATVQRRLAPVSRTFSQVIHAPVVEKTSEVLEKTIARPSVLAGATWTALIVGGLFYFIARHYGFPLSGSEMLFSLLAGAVIGILIEGVWRSLRRQ